MSNDSEDVLREIFSNNLSKATDAYRRRFMELARFEIDKTFPLPKIDEVLDGGIKYLGRPGIKIIKDNFNNLPIDRKVSTILAITRAPCPENTGQQIIEITTDTLKKILEFYSNSLVIFGGIYGSEKISMFLLNQKTTDHFMQSAIEEIQLILRPSGESGAHLVSAKMAWSDEVIVDYDGSRDLAALEEGRKKSLLRQMRPVLTSLAPHPILSYTLGKGVDMITRHKVYKKIEEKRASYDAEFIKYINNLDKFFTDLRASLPQVAESITERARKVGIDALLEILNGIDPQMSRVDAVVKALGG